jgi:hypothetical protein
VAAEQQSPPAPTRAGRVALVGRPNVGKSTLLNRLVGEDLAITSRHPQTTREPVRGVLTRGPIQYVFVDTPGLHEPKTRLGHRMNGASRHAARNADVVVLLAEAVRDEASRARFQADLAVTDEIDAIRSGRLVTVLAITQLGRAVNVIGLRRLSSPLSALVPPPEALRPPTRLLSRALLIPPEDSFVDVERDQVSVRMAWAFRATFDRARVAGASVVAKRVPLTRGVHGWAGRWLVNGAGDGIVAIDLEPPQRARVLGVPVRLRQLQVSVDDPAALAGALARRSEADHGMQAAPNGSS